jgi:cytochrome c oxidase subunit 1
MFGKQLDERLGKIHFALTFLFYNLTFFPMHILGIGGEMRRIYDPTVYDYLRPLQPINVFISLSAFLLFASQLVMAWNIVRTLARGTKADMNPWHDCGLEWTVASPPPHGNFETTPTVYHGPYEYSVPGAARDYIPVNQPPANVEEARR